MARTFIDDWKILPRLMMLVFTFMSFRVVGSLHRSVRGVDGQGG